jgi:hypothetical protein
VTGSVLVAAANVHLDVISGVRGVYLDFAAKPTSAWTNPRDRLDVSNNQIVDPQDALQLINHLNAAGPGELAVLDPSDESMPPLLDVDGDGRVLPHDALYVINYLNRTDGSGEGEPEWTTDGGPQAWMPTLAVARVALDPRDSIVLVPARFDFRQTRAADVFPPLAWLASRESVPTPIGASRLASEQESRDDTFDNLAAFDKSDELLTEIIFPA